MRIVFSLFTFFSLTLAAQTALAAQVIDGWALASLTKQSKNGAAYMIITNPSDKKDVIVSVESDIAEITELHEMSFDKDGVMRMNEVEKLDIPARGTVKLEPGGYHIMLMGLEKPFEVGDSFDVLLTFENTGQQLIPVKVYPRKN